MERNAQFKKNQDEYISNFDEICKIKEESLFTLSLIEHVTHFYKNKRYIIDAAGLQMLKPDLLLNLDQKAILTPHQKEFELLFGVNLKDKTFEEKIYLAQKYALKYRCVILLKAIIDIVTDGEITYLIEGGNQGLTKGGTGDVLAGLVASFYTKNTPLISAVSASFFLKKTADMLYETNGYWYNVEELINTIPKILKTELL